METNLSLIILCVSNSVQSNCGQNGGLSSNFRFFLLSLYLSIHLSMVLSIYLSLSFFLALFLYLSLLFTLSVSVSLSMSLSVSVSLSMSLSVSVTLSLSVSLSVYLSPPPPPLSLSFSSSLLRYKLPLDVICLDVILTCSDVVFFKECSVKADSFRDEYMLSVTAV